MRRGRWSLWLWGLDRGGFGDEYGVFTDKRQTSLTINLNDLSSLIVNKLSSSSIRTQYSDNQAHLENSENDQGLRKHIDQPGCALRTKWAKAWRAWRRHLPSQAKVACTGITWPTSLAYCRSCRYGNAPTVTHNWKLASPEFVYTVVLHH